MPDTSFAQALKRFTQYGLGEFINIIGELSQESAKNGALNRRAKELITLGVALAKRCQRCIDIHTQDARAQGASDADINQVKKIVLFLNAAPRNDDAMFEQWKASWMQFSHIHGPLAYYERELIALAIAIQRHHADQQDLHILGALSLGATAEQVVEIMPIVLLMDGAPALSQIPSVMRALETHQATVQPQPAE